MVRARKTTRDVISSIISDLPKGVHLSAQELKEKMEADGRTVSLSTVYRALERLNEEGEVRSIMSIRGQLWEVSDQEEQHDHLICTRCGITIEFRDTLVSGFGKTLAERKGYEYLESRFDIFGFCSSCKDKTDQLTLTALQEILEEAQELVGDVRMVLERAQEELSKGQSSTRERLAAAKGLLIKTIGKCDEGLDLV